MSSAYPFTPLTLGHAFTATNSAGTPLLIAGLESSNKLVNSYLIQNLSTEAAYIKIAESLSAGVQDIPAASPNAGDSILLRGFTALVMSGPPNAYFNAQTSSGVANLCVNGGLSNIN